MKLGENLKKYRKEHGMSQEELATQINVTRQAISAWETGKAVPAVSTLKILADYYNISIEELCGMENIKKETEPALEKGRFRKNLFSNKHRLVEMIFYLVLMVTTCYYMYFGILFDAYVLFFYKCENKKIQFLLKAIAVVCLGVSIYNVIFFLEVFGTEGTTTIEKL